MMKNIQLKKETIRSLIQVNLYPIIWIFLLILTMKDWEKNKKAAEIKEEVV
jgi:hypothetical protein